jgi:adenine-specific DNA-methyltransferase
MNESKKPERLIKWILDMFTVPGDLVLDSFLGSGTTAAVAHKMRRRWIGVELGEHCDELALPRLRRVVSGQDPTGITRATNWRGGGGFRYYNLAPSLLKRDRWGQWVINREQFNPEQLSEAVCKIEGFRFNPSKHTFWQQGQSTERDFIYVTTATLSAGQLEELAREVGPDRSLVVCCSGWVGSIDHLKNLTVKRIPRAVLDKCEFGKDDYSLTIAALQPAETAPQPTVPTVASATRRAPKKGKKPKPNVGPDLFATEEATDEAN